MNFLSDTQRAEFAATNARFGLGPEEFTAQLSDVELAKLPETRMMSSTGHTDFPRHIISIGSIEEMRSMAGYGDTYSDAKTGGEPAYPPEITEAQSREWLGTVETASKEAIPEEIRKNIHAAMIAYVTGDPARVAGYVSLINATHFPGRAAVFTGDVLKVPEATKLVIQGEDPVLLNFGHITVAKGATIRVNTRVFFQSQIFTQE
jgi:hypothetical protein